jgi:hypothetical protein
LIDRVYGADEMGGSMRAQEIIDPETAELEQTEDPIDIANVPPT